MIRQRQPLKRYTPLKRLTKPIRRDARSAEDRARDSRWRRDVMERDGYRCQCADFPGLCWGVLDPHHIHGKATKELRWGVENGQTLCRRHHRWAHDNPNAYREIMKQRRKV